MILSKLIVKWLEWIIEIGIWVILLISFVAGAKAADGFFASLFAGVIAMIVSGILSAVVFGFFIVLNDIRRMLAEAIAGGAAGSGQGPVA